MNRSKGGWISRLFSNQHAAASRSSEHEAPTTGRIVNVGVIVSSVSKEEVESVDLKVVNSWIGICVPAIKAGSERFPLVSLVFGGYDNDARSIFHIPEIVNWLKALRSSYPVVPYFMTKGSVQRYFAALAAVPLSSGNVRLDADLLMKLLIETFSAGNDYFDGILRGERPKCLELADLKIKEAVDDLLAGKWDPL